MSPADLPIPEAARALRRGDLTARTLAEAHLARIAEGAALHAFVAVTEPEALAAADAADRALADGTDPGPLLGIPFAVKDLIDIKGAVTMCGSRLFADRAPATATAPAVRRLLDAGAVPLGRLATYEFALTGPSFDGPAPPPVNPWDAGRITGGSSSGSAAAVAGGLVRLALGTDTGGSVRSPAAYCGCVGLKPTRGLVPTDGVFPLSPSLDHVGPLAASVADAALAMEALAPGCGAASALTSGVAGLTIGYARDWFAADPAASPGLIAAMDDAAATLSMLGARVTLVTMPDYALAEAAGAVLLHAEALEVHADTLRTGLTRYGRQARQSLVAGLGLTPEDVSRARRAGRQLTAQIDAALAPLDALIAPTTLGPAPALPPEGSETSVWTAMRTLPFNLTGHPALSLPIGFEDALPLAMQIVGRPGAEPTLCRIGAAFEAATDHAVPRPRSYRA